MLREEAVLAMAGTCAMTMRDVDTYAKRSGPHHSARYLILFATKADAMVALGERMLSLVDGCIVFIPPETTYYFSYGSRCHYYCLSFSPEGGDRDGLLHTMFEKRANILHVQDVRLRESLQFQAEQLYGLLHREEEGAYRQAYVNACFLKLFMDAFRLQEKMREKLPQNTGQVLSMQITAYLDENYLSAVTLEQLEKVFFLSRYHLCRQFKAQMKMSIVDYLHLKRVEHAIGLMDDADRSITKICYESGFGNLQSFHTVFKRYTQKTPLKYRKGKIGE